jgi:hypothetical protein
MANYYSPTVIQQSIPTADMTVLEILLLSAVFDSDMSGSEVYLFSEDGPSSTLYIDAAELREAVNDPAAIGTTAQKQILDQYGEEILGDVDVDIDASCGWWEAVLQDIVRRSDSLDHLTIITSFTCDKLRPDALGGMASLITANHIRAKATDELLAEFIAEAVEAGEMKPLT